MSRFGSFNVGASPVPQVAAAARRYSRQAGLNTPDPDYGRVVIPERASRAVSDAYDRLPDFDKKAVPAFRAMREEVGRQFDFMTKSRSKGGMGINVEVSQEDPYGGGNPLKAIGEFRDDVIQNSRMKVMSTKTTGGHPFFSDDENDMFRAVHDTFGHLGSGRGIDFDGEEAAYQKHSRMFSPLARQALATETRGQNSGVRVHGDFQDQKVALLPKHMQSLQFSQPKSFEERMAAVTRARAKNQEQGI